MLQHDGNSSELDINDFFTGHLPKDNPVNDGWFLYNTLIQYSGCMSFYGKRH